MALHATKRTVLTEYQVNGKFLSVENEEDLDQNPIDIFADLDLDGLEESLKREDFQLVLRAPSSVVPVVAPLSVDEKTKLGKK